MSNRAWVTLATNDSYGLGALVLAHSLRRAGSVYPAVVLITPSVTEAMRNRLSAIFAEVVTVDVLDSQDAAHLALLQRPELGITFTKVHCWNLTQYQRCVFLDADTLVIQNCDELFEREELSAAPDVGWPDCFNSGVFVFSPSADTFSRLITFAQERGSFDGGDQGLLNSFFSDWAHGDINKHLPFLYNVTSAAFYSYLPALKHYGQNLKIIHFIGAAKPWLQHFNWESRSVDAPSHLKELLQLWWDLFVSNVHSQLDTAMSGVAGNLAKVVPGSAQREAVDELTRRQGWEAGNIDYMGADSFDNIWAKISQTLNQPRSSPPKQSPPREPAPEPEQVEVKSGVVSQELGPDVEVAKEAVPVEIASPTAVDDKVDSEPQTEAIPLPDTPQSETAAVLPTEDTTQTADVVVADTKSEPVVAAPTEDTALTDVAVSAEATTLADGTVPTNITAPADIAAPIKALTVAEAITPAEVTTPVEAAIPLPSTVDSQVEVPVSVDASKAEITPQEKVEVSPEVAPQTAPVEELTSKIKAVTLDTSCPVQESTPIESATPTEPETAVIPEPVVSAEIPVSVESAPVVIDEPVAPADIPVPVEVAPSAEILTSAAVAEKTDIPIDIPAPVAEADKVEESPSSPAANASLASTDSPPLAHTPSKEEAPTSVDEVTEPASKSPNRACSLM